MVKRSEHGDLGGLWLQSYGLPVRSEVMGRFHRVRRAASRLQLQSEEPLVASHHAAKTATLSELRHSSFHEFATRQYLNGQTKRGEVVSSGGVWLEGHGLSEGSEVRGLSSRVRRAAPRLQKDAD